MNPLRDRQTSRLKGYDYSRPGNYFVTITCKNRNWYFGEPFRKRFQINESGEIAQSLWLKIPEQFPNAITDDMVVMPNHIHGILRLKELHATKKDGRTVGGATGLKNPMIGPNGLSKIIRWFKARVTYEIRKKANPGFRWQGRFYDRIIRNTEELDRIRSYICTNPDNWNNDYNFMDFYIKDV